MAPNTRLSKKLILDEKGIVTKPSGFARELSGQSFLLILLLLAFHKLVVASPRSPEPGSLWRTPEKE